MSAKCPFHKQPPRHATRASPLVRRSLRPTVRSRELQATDLACWRSPASARSVRPGTPTSPESGEWPFRVARVDDQRTFTVGAAPDTALTPVAADRDRPARGQVAVLSRPRLRTTTEYACSVAAT